MLFFGAPAMLLILRLSADVAAMSRRKSRKPKMNDLGLI